MPDGVYIAYTGAAANQAHLETIANNVANASTAGFQRDQTVFDTVLAGTGAFARASSGQIDLSPGTHQLTKNPLNVAINGDGFFVVNAPDGGELYTKLGDFRLNSAGQLVLPNGLQVTGEGGSLSVSPGTPVELRGDGNVMTPDGPAGRLRLVRFNNPADLRKVGRGLLEAGPNAGLEEVRTPQLSVGFVEASNVSIALEMVNMIQATRAIEASMKSLKINDEITQRLIQVQR